MGGCGSGRHCGAIRAIVLRPSSPQDNACCEAHRSRHTLNTPVVGFIFNIRQLRASTSGRILMCLLLTGYRLSENFQSAKTRKSWESKIRPNSLALPHCDFNSRFNVCRRNSKRLLRVVIASDIYISSKENSFSVMATLDRCMYQTFRPYWFGARIT